MSGILIKKLEYEVKIDGIGRHWGGDHSHGFCSQAAIFERKCQIAPQPPPIYNGTIRPI